MRVYRGKFGYILAIISESSVGKRIRRFLIILLFDFWNFWRRKKFDSISLHIIRYNFTEWSERKFVPSLRLLFDFWNFWTRKKFDSISLHTIRYNFTQITDSLRARKTSILSDFLLFFFWKRSTIPLQKKEKKEGRGSLIVFIFTWREIVHQRWHRYQHTSRVFPLGLNERRQRNVLVLIEIEASHLLTRNGTCFFDNGQFRFRNDR